MRGEEGHSEGRHRFFVDVVGFTLKGDFVARGFGVELLFSLGLWFSIFESLLFYKLGLQGSRYTVLW